VVEDGYAGDNGAAGGFTKGIGTGGFVMAFGWIPGHCMIEGKSINAYGSPNYGFYKGLPFTSSVQCLGWCWKNLALEPHNTSRGSALARRFLLGSSAKRTHSLLWEVVSGKEIHFNWDILPGKNIVLGRLDADTRAQI